MAEYPKIVSELKERIDQQIYTEKLPPLSQLAAEFHVNINTVQRAINELKHLKYVYSVNGSGIFVSHTRTCNFRKTVTVFGLYFSVFHNQPLYIFLDSLQRELASMDIGMEIAMHFKLPNPDSCQAVLIHTKNVVGEQYEELKNHIMPQKIYYFDNFAPDIQLIGIDNRAAGGEAIEYLYQTGHRNIAVIALSLVPGISFYERNLGAEQAAAQHPDLRMTTYNLGDTADADDEVKQAECFAKILSYDPPVDGVFCLMDRLAFQFITYCREHGVNVPDDISVIGYDNQRFMQFFQPGLTTFEEPYEELAAITAKRLAHPIRKPGEPEQMLIRPVFIPRESVRDRNQQS